jgi:sugar phosphate isomerase/epimerase
MRLDPQRLQTAFDEAHALGASYVVSSVLRPGTGPLPYSGAPPQGIGAPMRAMTREDAKQTAYLANQIGASARSAGLQYCYHNHYFEFVDQGDGGIGYDQLLHDTDPALVQFEIDCGWMAVAGHDPVAYLKRYPGRFPMVHVKDFLAPEPAMAGGAMGALRVSTELGTGVVDLGAIIPVALEAGVRHFFVEQEAPFRHMTQLQAAAVDYAYLARALAR